MKKKYTAFFLLILTIAAGVFLAFSFSNEKAKPVVQNEIDHKIKKASSEAISKETFNEQSEIEQLVADMTIDEKIGQMMVVGFQSSELDEHAKKMIEDYHVGGIILFDRNMDNPKQVATLNQNLQKLALEQEHQIPLIISVDQEGGQIVRMKEKVSPIPSQQELGKQSDENKVYESAYHNAQELNAMGFNVNFAPVLDLSETDTRSFGTDPQKAAVFSKQVIKGFHDGNITGALKHFPGHGRTTVDPHVETSAVKVSSEELENQDIYPFANMIHTVDYNQFFVMVTHVKYPAYDKENPASVSPIIINDLLREKLGYQGLVVTDDLEMGAVNKYFTYGDLGAKAVGAGVDLLLVCHTFENQEKVFRGIKNAVEAGQISEERLDEAVKRILSYKQQAMNREIANPQKAEQLVGK
ncbi:beta-N-acetylhexosaminidase [Priestia flexa]|uniref:beta-N-acetylhexosaminidase n=1 Tax=Priestia flexa TaxID=86664 RepID=UPI00240E39BA|nr:beta-N-acetylhexosaminidase [Priestia flexa]WEZ07937.1 beta-N-acetylhexosaminidase [Priestia flexa]